MSPQDIDPTAPSVDLVERFIDAPVDRLWRLHTEVERWPDWQEDVGSASLDGAFAVGQSITWTTTGLADPIVSTIYVVKDRVTTLWGGPSAGIDGIHRWTFKAIDGGTQVSTEESWAGLPVEANPAEATKMLDSSLVRWLDFLSAAATAR